ncbi:hypothetical protein Ahy_B07g088330 [Arachis hypogaea]|uniref:Transposase MuDR plant domain-containing protein n=1 Tax=Arachis hypogaea TaxID=3818 RepID=A0A444YE87_ARAHY|nr:hypothetical protein Ahy_B07g088330 [Arachis hypogaea]
MGDISEGQELVLYGGVDEGRKQSEPFATYSRAKDDNEVGYDNSSGSDSLDSEYNPYGEEDDSEDDVHFTDSDDELDPEFDNNEGGDSDDLDFDHQVGADGSDSEHEGFTFLVHKLQKDMSKYKWEVGTVYASRQEFKDTVTAYVVHTARSIRFRKCDLQRVRAVCSGDCPFWVYAAKIKAFKKKVESNPKVKTRELVSKAQKKWNLTVTKSLATKTKQIALDQIQETFREQYKRIYDYGQELMRANPGSSVRLQVQRVDIWERTAHSDVMPPPYRRPSHRPVKKRRAAAGDEEQSSRTHLSRKGEKQRCSLYGSVGHNRSRCPKPIEELQSKNKGKQQQGSTKSNHLSAKGGRKTASSQPNPKQSVKRKAVSATQPPSAAQSNNAAQPKRPRGRPKKTTKPKSSTQSAPQPNKVASPTSSAPPSSSSQPATRTIPSSQPTLTTSSSQPVGHFSTRLSGAPHISPKKLKLMSKLPPSKWEML